MTTRCADLARDPAYLQRAIARREDALRLFLCTLDDADPAVDRARASVLDAHPDLIGEVVRSMVPGAIAWLFDHGRFLAEDRLEADFEMLYVALVRSEAVPEVHHEAASVFMRFGAPPPDPAAAPDAEGFYDLPDTSRLLERAKGIDAYIKCMLAIAPYVPDDMSHADVWNLMTRLWGADDVWLVTRLMQHYYGVGMNAPAAFEDVMNMIALAERYLVTAPKCAIALARQLELFQFELADFPALDKAFREAVGRLNRAAAELDAPEQEQDEPRYNLRKRPLRTRGAAEPGFHADKRALFSEAGADFAAEWRAHLEETLRRAPTVPRDAAGAVRVLRVEYHVCHECMDLLPASYLQQVESLCAVSRPGRQYLKLCRGKYAHVHPIEFAALDYLLAREEDADHSTGPDVRLYVLDLERRCRAEGRLDEFRGVAARHGRSVE